MERIIAENKQRRKKLLGFSLLEMIVAIFIFAMVITVTISVFIASYRGQKRAKEIQQGMENSRVAIELMAKNIRMGAVDSPDNDDATEIAFYNYSQGKCIKYEFDGEKIKVGEETSTRTARPDCSVVVASNSLISDLVAEDLKFNIIKSDYMVAPPVIGRVTISIKIKNSNEPIQTTVSLRDYVD
jgi:type II secretory pathway pseudopilin PulG